MEKSIEARLEEIFKEWYERMYSEKSYLEDKKEPFTKDGILFNENIPANIIEDMWKLSSRRVLFLLKDQNQKGKDKWFEDIRDWLRVTEFDRDKEHNKNSDKSIAQKEKNKNLKNKFLCRMAFLIWGLSKLTTNTVDDWPEGEVIAAHKKGDVKDLFNTIPFALVECKKLPGGPKLYDNILLGHLDEYGDFLTQEIETLNPNIIVCSGNQIFEFVVKYFSQSNEIEKLPNIYGGEYEIDGKKVPNFTTCLWYDQEKNIVVINSFHPSDRVENWMYFEKVMSPFRAFIREHSDF